MEDWDWEEVDIGMVFQHLYRLRGPHDIITVADGNLESRATLDSFLDTSSDYNLIHFGGSPWYNRLFEHRWNDGHTKVRVICKIAAGDRDPAEAIRNEAAFYESEAGKKLQSCHDIPRYFGVFAGEVEDVTLTCIVLEHCGEALNSSDALVRQGQAFW